MAVKFINNQSEDIFSSIKFLFRIVTLQRLSDFQNNKFVFVSPSKWTDPYEKAFLCAKYKFNENLYSHPLFNNLGYKVFAQCWTASKQSEAMWRVFAPDKNGVIVKMSLKKLKTILTKISADGLYDFYIGKVKYEDEDSLYGMKADYQVWQSIAESKIDDYTLGLLLKKRKAFNVEDEFRIIAVKNNAIDDDPIKSFTINGLLKYVEYLKFDPRMSDSEFESEKSKILTVFSKVKIIKSRLYNDPIGKLTFGGSVPVEEDDEFIFN
ncbi:MAG: DUF2971 domain-containing protein [Saprospiraceae bacterium]